VTAAPGAEDAAEAVFAAMADPTRRAVLRGVAEDGPLTATELAGRLPVSRQAIAKHLAILEDAGLVRPERSGRENRWSVTPQPLADAGRWLAEAGSAWDDRLQRLEQRLADRRAGAARPSEASDGG
jgi:DNA-binding transcriptional ArsR family regulator